MILLVAGCSATKQETCRDKQEETVIKNDFWEEQSKGSNFMNSTSLPDNYEEANEFNIEFVRLAPDKWAKDRDFLFNDQPDSNSQKDFLIGNADKYEGIVEEDFKKLKKDLDAAYERGSKVVLTVLSLPGNRWRQVNNYENDDRIWRDFSYHEQAALFWKDLATRLKDHPAVVGYNLITEPHPETATGFHDFWAEDYDECYSQVENTPADLNKLYSTIVESIRSVDTNTPIIFKIRLYATPWAFEYLKPIEDENVLYAFHMHEPYEMTSQNRNKGFTYSYPGKVKVGGKTKKIWRVNVLLYFLFVTITQRFLFNMRPVQCSFQFSIKHLKNLSPKKFCQMNVTFLF
ncbi:glycoside hydrolase family 5 protein [Lysinibacillus sphaericus]|uniref:glycoside hydrolase family 5 protein n=1 Tax=Lysinibacillus sphaericus TaxID=1421 RepID=UPI003D042B24